MNTPSDPHPATLARALEERGFESLWYGEHSHIPCSRRTPYPPGGELPTPYRRMMDPYLSLMTTANATSDLRLGTGIALLMERDLFSQAKTIATLDRLSGGRVLIGTGVGWNREEFENICPHPSVRKDHSGLELMGPLGLLAERARRNPRLLFRKYVVYQKRLAVRT